MVKNWSRNGKNKAQIATIWITDETDLTKDQPNMLLNGINSNSALQPTYDTDDDNDDDIPRSKAGKRGVPSFICGTDGKIVSPGLLKQIFTTARGFFNDEIDRNRNSIPANWTASGQSLRDKFRYQMGSSFFCLRLGEGHWKIDMIWKRTYHSWLRSYTNRLDTEGIDYRVVGKKRKKARGSSEDEDEDEDDDEPHVKISRVSLVFV